MPIMTLNNKTLSFCWTDINELSTLAVADQIRALCWGWGVIKYDPVKFFKSKKDRKNFTVRSWVYLGGKDENRQEIRIDISGVYAEGCQYLTKGDPIFFLGLLQYDHKYSELKHFPFFIVDAQMVIPPYSADGREFCARKNALIERQTAELVSKYASQGIGDIVPGMTKLEGHLKLEEELNGNI